MSVRAFTVATAYCFVLAASVAMAPTLGADIDKPDLRVADLMVAAQLRHIKLWFAGKQLNWLLAAYELDLVRGKLQEAAASPPGPQPDPVARPMQALHDAIETKNAVAFTAAYAELSNACNSCHRATGHGFISIQVPATSPFSDELFVDEVAEGRGLAHMICGACHVVDENANETPVSRFPAPSFPSLARRPALTDDSLRQMLLANHRNLGRDQTMPNPRLAEYQIDEIIAYFTTLRAKAGR